MGSCFSSGNPHSSSGVSWISESLNGEEVIAVFIHDQTIARKVQSVRAIFPNGRQVTVPTNGQRGVFVHNTEGMDFQKIILYTADGKEVYRL